MADFPLERLKTNICLLSPPIIESNAGAIPKHFQIYRAPRLAKNVPKVDSILFEIL